MQDLSLETRNNLTLREGMWKILSQSRKEGKGRWHAVTGWLVGLCVISLWGTPHSNLGMLGDVLITSHQTNHQTQNSYLPNLGNFILYSQSGEDWETWVVCKNGKY